MTETISFEVENFERTAREALTASSTYIRDAILGNVDLSKYLIKGDKTASTVVDHGSQELALPVIRRALGKYKINAEEAEGPEGTLDSLIRIFFDPLDGTGGFLMGGATPTVILGAHNEASGEVLAAATMEPISGRYWFSSRGEGAWLNCFDYGTGNWTHSKRGIQLHVNEKQVLKGGSVLVL